MRTAIAVAALGCLVVCPAAAQPYLERNVVYGMYSGLALLMDVHRPSAPNGHGIVYIGGSGFNAPLALNAPALKDGDGPQVFARKLTAVGYTVFVPNHRATPRFQYPAAVEDVQRAVRFVRAHASSYGIDPSRMGAAGTSSGGHLVGMLATLDGTGDPEDPDPVNRVSARVQAVAALMGAFDLRELRAPPTGLFLGALMTASTPSTALEYKLHLAASPIHHVSSDDAPFLLLHGDKDALVPIQQSIAMEAALRKAGVDVKFVPVPGGRHALHFGFQPGDPALPDYLGEIATWFDRHLLLQAK